MTQTSAGVGGAKKIRIVRDQEPGLLLLLTLFLEYTVLRHRVWSFAFKVGKNKA
jgi:hypothetical protein